MATKIKVSIWVNDNHVLYRNPEDCSECVVKEGYYITATTKEGRRWIHSHIFHCQEQLGNFLNRLDMAGNVIDVDKDCWTESDPVYGSKEYEQLGIEQHWAARERAEAAWY